MDRTDLGSEQLEKQTSKKLKARGKGDGCRGVVWDQYFDSHISDIQIMVLAGFSLPGKLEIRTVYIAQVFTGVLWGMHASAGCPKRGGGQLPIMRCPFRDVCSDFMYTYLFR